MCLHAVECARHIQRLSRTDRIHEETLGEGPRLRVFLDDFPLHYGLNDFSIQNLAKALPHSGMPCYQVVSLRDRLTDPFHWNRHMVIYAKTTSAIKVSW